MGRLELNGKWSVPVAWLYAVVVGACTLLIVIGGVEEPYNIDELRQVSTYGRDLAGLVDGSLQQQQPPLDWVVNSGVQRLVGEGDLKQRAVSIAAAAAALGLLSLLCLAGGLRAAGVVAVVLLGSAPLFVEHAAYARPYALPLALLLGFCVAAQRWLSGGGRGALAALVVTALLLPLSRTTEPTMFLAAVALIFAVRWILHRRQGKRDLVVAAVAAGAVVLVGVPVYLAVRAQADLYVAGPTESLSDQLLRIVTDVPSAAAAMLPVWPVSLGLVLLALAVGPSRRWLLSTWWWWALLVTPVVFVVAFLATTPASQVFYGRYVFFWLPALAVTIGALVHAMSGPGQPRLLRWVSLLGVAILLLVQTWGLAQLLTTQKTRDFAEAVEVMLVSTTKDTLVVFDRPMPLGGYRWPFYGGRYLDGRRSVVTVKDLITRPGKVDVGEPTALLVTGRLPDGGEIPGWVPVPVDEHFTLYVPTAPPADDDSAITALMAFASALGPDQGAALRLAAAAQLDHRGRDEEAREIVESVVATTSPAASAAVGTELRRLGREDLLP